MRLGISQKRIIKYLHEVDRWVPLQELGNKVGSFIPHTTELRGATWSGKVVKELIENGLLQKTKLGNNHIGVRINPSVINKDEKEMQIETKKRQPKRTR